MKTEGAFPLSSKQKKKAQISCEIQMKSGAYMCSGIYFFITVAFKPFLTKVRAFYECFRRAVAKLNDS